MNTVIKYSEIGSRQFLGFWFLICAIDGWAYLLFDYHMASFDGFIFVGCLVKATYFWAFLKTIQLLGAISLIFNIRPVLGFALITPISCVLALFYFFELQMFAWAGVLIVISSAILFRKHKEKFLVLVEK